MMGNADTGAPEPIIDLDYYTWREWKTDGDGKERLLIPWSDAMKYENDFGYVFASVQEAVDFKENDENALEEDWVLVHFRGEIVRLIDGQVGDSDG